MTSEHGGNLIPASSTAITRKSSNALVVRGLRSIQTHIFIVDDEEAIRDLIHAMLRIAGYDCREFANGVEALAALNAGENCNLLLTDLMNAPMDGLTLLIHVKEQFPTIPVIFATAIHDYSAAEECIRKGAFDYLLEPFERSDLLRVVRNALEGCEGQTEFRRMQHDVKSRAEK